MISSTANSKVKRLTALVQKAKLRREEQLFVVEGVRMFGEAPDSWIREVYVSEAFLHRCEQDNEHIFDTAIREKLNHYRYEVLTDEVFRRVSDTQTPQGVLCVLAMPHYQLAGAVRDAGCACIWQTDTGRRPLLVLLEDLQDPGNLGTILRAGEGAGIDGVIMTRRTVDIFNPKVIRATMGSIYRVPFYVVDDLGEAIDFLKSKGIQVYAAQPDGSVDYDEQDYTGPAAFLIGNEGNGLLPATAAHASQYIGIPMAGQVESLNAAAAAAILMYEAARQRRKR